ncbi:hypothetical protein LQZ18_04460 [Lachnospiraceae bacterium ZAX-1]
MIKKMVATAFKHLTNHLGLKVLSVVFSVVLWLVVVGIDDPEITRSFTIPVTVQNKELVEKMGKVYDIINDTNVASFSFTGKRSYVEKMTPANFTAMADLGQVDFTQESEVKTVPIVVKPDKWETQFVIVRQTANMQITIEDLSSEQFVITSLTYGTPAKGYARGNIEATPSLIKVSGPQSVVSKIEKVVVSVNIEGLKTDVTDNVIPMMYDESENIIESDQLTLNHSSILVRIQILSTKSLPITCSEVEGQPADGYQLTNLEYAPGMVTVKGKAADLNAIDEIAIPRWAIDIQGATADVEKPIDITPYLPEGITLVDADANQIAVKAIIEQLATKSIEFSVKNIVVDNIPPEEYKWEFVQETITIRVRGLADDIDAVSAEDVIVKLNLEGLDLGSHPVEAEVIMADNFKVLDQVMVQIVITENKSENENTVGPDNTGGSMNKSSVGNQEDSLIAH